MSSTTITKSSATTKPLNISLVGSDVSKKKGKKASTVGMRRQNASSARKARCITGNVKMAHKVEPETLLQTRKENNRFVDNLKTEAESARAEHIASKKLLPSSAFQVKLGISKQAISKAVKENRMFAVLGPSGKNFYPAFFSEEKYDRRHLEKVCKALGTLPGGSKWQFFTTPKGSLDGKTPLEALALGQVDAVMISAAGFVEH